jgi:signal transduction histidine kinase
VDVAETAIGARVTPSPDARDRFGWLLLLLFVALVVLTGVVYLWPGISYAVDAPELDEVLNTTAVVIAASVALRAWVRYHETNEIDALLQSSAFVILFLDGLLRIALSLADSPLYEGYAAAAPGQAPLYGWTVRRLLAGGLLLAAAYLPRRTARLRGIETAGVLFIPAVLVLFFSLLVLGHEAALPVLVPTAELQRILQPGQTFDVGLVSLPLLITQLVPGALFALAALLYWGRSERTGLNGRLLSIALLLAAFSQLNYALVPGVYSDTVPSGDFLRIGFYVLMLVAVAVATATDLVQLRRANAELQQLRAAEAEHAAVQERARLAREIHDGMAQELWLARLTTGSLAESTSLAGEDRKAVDRLDGILDRALSEARQAIVTLQPGIDERFGELLRRYVDDYADHFGMEIECVTDADVTPEPRAQAHLLRICREALNNARRHADASVVRVHLTRDADSFSLAILDNGRGFNPAHARAGFGLESMRQRAEALGARLDIQSAPMDGTRVTVTLPSVSAT